MNAKKRILLLLLTLFTVSTLVFAQTKRTITGVVSDNNGKPVPAATVTVKGTTKSVLADDNGKYSIVIEGNNAKLVFSSVGFVLNEVPVTGGSTLNVELVSLAKEISEVTVTALGIKREKRSLGYATQTVGGKDLTVAQAPTIAQGLMGKVAGLQISQAGGGSDGGSSRIVVRGNTTISGGDNRAMIVVDGVTINNDPVNVNNNNGGNGKSVLGGQGADVSGYNDWGTGMNNINPEDIESVTVLKGPSAVALYGARGGNGVILITRKKGGTHQGLGLDYTFTTRNTNAYSMMDYQNEYGQGGVASFLSADQTKWFPYNAAGQRMQIGNGTNGAGNYVNNSHGPMPYAGASDFYTYFSYPGSYSWGPRMDGQPIMNYDGVMRPYSPQPNNWKAFFPNGSVTAHTVALSASSENASVRLSYTRNQTKPNMINSNMQTNTFNLGSSVKVSKRVTAEISGSYINLHRLNAPQTGAGWQAAPTYSMSRDFNAQQVFAQQFGPNGEQVRFDAYPAVANAPAFPWNTGYLNNQYWSLLKNNSDYGRNQLLGSIRLLADVTNWLNITGTVGVDNSNDLFTVKQSPIDVLGQASGLYRETLSKYLSTNMNALARVHKENLFGKEINASLTGGVEQYYRSDYQVSNATAGNFVRPFLFALNNGANAVPTPEEIKYTKKINSVMGLLNLSYRNYLFLEGTLRKDWFSTLTIAKNSDNSIMYPSANLAFVFTEGIKGMETSVPWLNFGKLKLSYGETGSDGNVLPAFVHNQLESVVYNGVQAQSLLSAVKAGNIQPARNRSFELGLTLGFLKNRLNLDITAYTMKSFNQILSNPLPVSSGYSSIVINTGSLRNKGLEIVLSGSPIKNKDFSWDVSVNASKYSTRLLALSDGLDQLQLGSYFGTAGISQRVKVGEKYGTLYGKDFTYIDGQRVVMRATTNAQSNGTPITYTAGGKTYYAGTQWVLTPTEVPIGNSLPAFTGGISNTFRYKNFSLYVMTDAKIGGDTYFGSYSAGMQTGALKETLKERNGGGLPYVYPDGTTGNVGINFGGVFADKTPNTDVVHYLWYYSSTYSAWNHIGRPTSPSVFKNSWMKMREVALTYQVPQDIVKKTKVLQNLSVSVIGRDLFYIFTTIPKGLNPEGVNGIGDIQGIEYASMPRTRSFGLSVRTSL